MTDTTSSQTAVAGRDLGALTGLACAVVFIGGLVVTDVLVPAAAPSVRPDAAAASIQRYFVENAGAARAQALTQTTAALFLLLFTGSLTSLVRRAEPRPTGLTAAAAGGGILAAAFLAVSALLAGTLGAEQISDSPATVSALRQLSFFVGGTGHTLWLGVLVGAVSLAARRGRLLPHWLTAAGLVSAALSMLSLIALVVPATALFIPLGRFSGLLVIAVASVLMATGRTGNAPARASKGATLIGGLSAVVLGFLVTVFMA